MISFGTVPAGAVLPIAFTTYGKTNGESITLTGLAVTDIEVYKGTSMTQRASDAGYALMDTDGIDIDGVTGFHGFSIDTGDNTDAGFYVAGSFYTVLVSAITVDSQTVSFIAATFRLCAAEHTAGYPVATIKDGTGTGEINTNGGKVVGVELVDTLTTYTGNTVQTGDAYARLGAPAGASVSADVAALDLLLDAAIAAIVDLPTNAELSTALGTADDAVLAAIAALNNLSAAQVNAEVVDALATDTYAEPTGVPSATIALAAKINWLYKALRNRVDVTSSAKTFYDDGGATEWKKALSDDGTTYSEAEASTP